MSEKQQEKVPGWVNFLNELLNKRIFEAPGKRIVKIAWWVDFGKIFPLFLFLGWMVYYDNFSMQTWVYVGLHSVYGYCWLIKDFGFRDHMFEQKTSVLGVLIFYMTLGVGYMSIPWLFISRHVEPTGFELFIAIVIHHLGVVIMMAADEQRHFVLKHKRGLITDGIYRYTRNPNYLGEIMLYSAYAFLADHWFAWLVIFVQTFVMFMPRMYIKDHSISRHPGWAEYKATSGLLIPWGLLSGRAFRDLFSDRDKELATIQAHATPEK